MLMLLLCSNQPPAESCRCPRFPFPLFSVRRFANGKKETDFYAAWKLMFEFLLLLSGARTLSIVLSKTCAAYQLMPECQSALPNSCDSSYRF